MQLANSNFASHGALYFRAADGHWVALDGRKRVYLSYDDGQVFHSDISRSGLYTCEADGPVALTFTMSRRESLSTYRWKQELWCLGDRLVLDGKKLGIEYMRRLAAYHQSAGDKHIGITLQGKKYLVNVAAMEACGHSPASLRKNVAGDIRDLGVLVCGGKLFVKTELPWKFFTVFNYCHQLHGLGSLGWTTQSVCGPRP